jgi:hypothetical protein
MSHQSLRLAERSDLGAGRDTRLERTARTPGAPGSERNGGAEDATKQDGHVGVDDESERKMSCFEIGQRLGEVDRSEPVDGLELDDQALCHQQVGPHLAHEMILVDDRQRWLPNERDAPSVSSRHSACL